MTIQTAQLVIDALVRDCQSFTCGQAGGSAESHRLFAIGLLNKARRELFRAQQLEPKPDDTPEERISDDGLPRGFE